MTIYYRRNPEVLSCELGEEAVLLEPDASMYFGLNPTAALLWRELSEPKAIDQLVEKITSEFEVSNDEALADVAETLGQMLSLKLIVQIQEY